ncbi:MAG: nucleotidyltransferase family protein [Myxococcota bacterium]|jgi:molybdenum cofactor cytidylyltransferase|nr:nucleotidyltransferase family protein [Myxococcota bacterium]
MICGVLLAAGASRRMGRDKLALPWRGTTVLAATLARWQAARLDLLLLVRRPGAPDAPPGVQVVLNPDADEGMGSSLRRAVRALPVGTDAVVVGLADMPEVTTATLDLLVDAWRPCGPAGIVAPSHDGRRGHPVVFGAAHLPALALLGGDQGARALLATGPVTLLPVADPGVLRDLDTPADLEAAPCAC